MPTDTGYYYGFFESNPRLWAQCINEAKKTMLADGWVIHAKKFFTVHIRKAQILFRAKSK